MQLPGKLGNLLIGLTHATIGFVQLGDGGGLVGLGLGGGVGGGLGPANGRGELMVRGHVVEGGRLRSGAALVTPQIIHELSAGYRAAGQRHGKVLDLQLRGSGGVLIGIASGCGSVGGLGGFGGLGLLIAVVEVLELLVGLPFGFVRGVLGVARGLFGFVRGLFGRVISRLGVVGLLFGLLQGEFQAIEILVESLGGDQVQLSALQIAAQFGLQSLFGFFDFLLSVLVSSQLLRNFGLPLGGSGLGLISGPQRLFGGLHRVLGPSRLSSFAAAWLAAMEDAIFLAAKSSKPSFSVVFVVIWVFRAMISFPSVVITPSKRSISVLSRPISVSFSPYFLSRSASFWLIFSTLLKRTALYAHPHFGDPFRLSTCYNTPEDPYKPGTLLRTAPYRPRGNRRIRYS